MNYHLENTTLFITGATAGFGAACARKFAQAEARLVLCGRREERLHALKKELGSRVHTICLDVRDFKAIEHAIGNLPEAFSSIDILINNAGLALGLEPAYQASLDDWEEMIDTNIKGVVYCTRMLLPSMVERNRGHIVNISSVAGSYPYPGGNVYGATKAFVKQFSLNLRADLLGTQIRVTNIEPGLCQTEFSTVRFKGDADKASKVYENMQPLTADDIATCIFWTATLPSHININRLEVMPVAQAFGPFTVHRETHK